MNRFKSLITLIFTAAIAGLSTSPASAAEDVILTVELNTALDSYYKLKDFALVIQKDEEVVTLKAQEIEKQRDALLEEFQELRQHANSDILKEEAKQEAYDDAQKKMAEIQAKENELRKFISDEQNKFRARQGQQMNLFYTEIAEVVTEISKERGATLVFDVTGRSGTIMYTDGSYDITDEVIKRINSTQGEDGAKDAAAE